MIAGEAYQEFGVPFNLNKVSDQHTLDVTYGPNLYILTFHNIGKVHVE